MLSIDVLNQSNHRKERTQLCYLSFFIRLNPERIAPPITVTAAIAEPVTIDLAKLSGTFISLSKFIKVLDHVSLRCLRSSLFTVSGKFSAINFILSWSCNFKK